MGGDWPQAWTLLSAPVQEPSVLFLLNLTNHGGQKGFSEVVLHGRVMQRMFPQVSRELPATAVATKSQGPEQ